jgi:hypothetical protein
MKGINKIDRTRKKRENEKKRELYFTFHMTALQEYDAPPSARYQIRDESQGLVVRLGRIKVVFLVWKSEEDVWAGVE